ncbi:MAG: long-chain fatty acid--CoA ligase [Acidobacteria bacterium]|nr:MAG: long-chain fatty acid--CoA ligase [Acidobacteriota bacterium]
MNFLDVIFHRLRQSPDSVILQEVRGAHLIAARRRDLLASIQTARAFLIEAGLRKGDRCVLLGANSIRWVALDLALMAEGIIVVPLYTRQAPRELVAIMKDCSPSLVLCGDETLRDSIAQQWSAGPPTHLFDEVFASSTQDRSLAEAPRALSDDDPVTIIYTSGTSGTAKGVVLTVGNVSFMIPRTLGRLDELMGPSRTPDRVFHYLPFCFAGSWILLLTCLSRNSVLTLSTDLSALMEEIKLAKPHYFLNVPVLLERLRAGIEEQLRQRGGLVAALFDRAREAWFRQQEGRTSPAGSLWLRLASALLFPTIRKSISPHLKALICGSAPLAKETQLFFMMLGIPVLQVYGLTETTAICTMDHPHHFQPGWVGPSIPGIEMKLGEHDEILVRGPHIFQGYWNRPQETAEALRDGWFHTGDQGEVNEAGYWRIIGRIKNLIILSSGHNVAPEPIENELLRLLPGAAQVVLFGHGRGFLTALVTGDVTPDHVQRALDRVNAELPHYKRVRAFLIHKEPFTPENGLLTANGKLKREAIAARFREQIEALYQASPA